MGIRGVYFHLLPGFASLGVPYALGFAQPTPGGGVPPGAGARGGSAGGGGAGGGGAGGGGAGGGGPFRPAFPGHRPGEEVVFTLQPHPIFAVFVAWRILLLLVFVGFLYFAWTTTAIALPPVFTILLIAVTLGLPVARLTLDELNLWYYRRYILTNWRVIDVRGFSFRRRKQLVLSQVQQVVVERPNIVAGWLDVGTVVVLSGGDQNDLRLEWVQHPSEVSHQIQLNELLAGPRVPGAAAFRSSMAREAWEKVDQVEDDLHYPADFPDDTPPITVPFELLHQYNERVLESISRHWSALAIGEIPPTIVAFAGILFYAITRSRGVKGAGIILVVTFAVVVVWGALQYLNFADDLFILTTLRVVDLDRVLYVVAENRRQAMYNKIQNVRAFTPFWGRVFGYGTIYIETAGRSEDLQMTHIAQASEVQDRIFQYMNAGAEHKEAIGRRRRRREAKLWMAELLNELLVEVPQVRGRSLLDAAQLLREAGLRMVIESERADSTVTPGTVLEQEPQGGSSALRGSETRLVLSRQAAPAARQQRP
jgi:uncharacterized membrane protein YdbT with pleckstrin-like domain